MAGAFDASAPGERVRESPRDQIKLAGRDGQHKVTRQQQHRQFQKRIRKSPGFERGRACSRALRECRSVVAFEPVTTTTTRECAKRTHLPRSVQLLVADADHRLQVARLRLALAQAAPQPLVLGRIGSNKQATTY